MHHRTKALQISRKVKERVYERDGCCVLCGSNKGEPVAHFIARSQGGLGIEENIITLCPDCHRRYDNSADRKRIREVLREYLESKYPGWDETSLYYHKEGTCKK